jgi:hypothetical protein
MVLSIVKVHVAWRAHALTLLSSHAMAAGADDRLSHPLAIASLGAVFRLRLLLLKRLHTDRADDDLARMPWSAVGLPAIAMYPVVVVAAVTKPGAPVFFSLLLASRTTDHPIVTFPHGATPGRHGVLPLYI